LSTDEHEPNERRVDTLRRAIAERLRPICEKLEADDFAELVDQIALTQRKYEQRAAYEFLAAGSPPRENAKPIA
jgi:hypothetical protein